jgi:hypothetical protein
MTEVKRPKLDAHGYIVWLRMRGDLPLLSRNFTGVVFNHLNQEEEEEIVRIVTHTGFITWETDGQFLAL